MKRKLLYSIVFLVVLAGVIVPLVYSNNGPQEKENLVSAETGKSSQEEEAILELSSPEVSNSPEEADDQNKQDSGEASTSPDAKTTPAKEEEKNSEVQPVEAAPQAACQVGVAVVGMDGELLYSPAQVKVKKDNAWGLTVLGALDATGMPYTMKPFWPGFVESIKGQNNKGTSGWMYLVNGGVPMHMADKHPVKEGDRVIWWYSKSMDQPSPQWDDLVK